MLLLHQKGFTNSVVIMGTVHLTPPLVPILKSLSKNIILALDSDNAGYEASKRANQLLLKRRNNKQVYIIFSK